MRQAERDRGVRAGPTSAEGKRLKALKRENRKQRQANEILRKASAYFAMAELDALEAASSSSPAHPPSWHTPLVGLAILSAWER